MKKTEKIRKEEGSLIMKQAILTLGLVALLCSPLMTLASHAGGNMKGNYQGMAYLAEQEIRAEELQVRAAEEAEMVADAEVTEAERNGEEQRQDDK